MKRPDDNRLTAWSIIASFALIALTVLLAVHVDGIHPAWHGNDARVYQLAAEAVVAGEPLTGVSYEGYPFTYPPFAALLLSPLALTPPWAFHLVTSGVPLLLLVAMVAVTLRAWHVQRWLLVTPVIALPMLLPYPVITGIVVGQIDTLVIALVMADLLVGRHRRWGGALIGFAAAVKLTPLVFLLWFVVRRDWRGLATSLGVFVSAGLVALTVLPGDSVTFWTRTLFETDRVGRVAVALNQSWAAPIARAMSPESPVLSGGARIAWLCTSVAIVALGAWTAGRLVRAGQVVMAGIAIAVVGLLVSPVTWSHHWTWIAPALLVSWLDAGTKNPRWLIAFGAVLLSLPAHWLFGNFIALPGAPPSWSWWQQVIGAAVPIWATLTLALLGVSTRRVSRRRQARSNPATST